MEAGPKSLSEALNSSKRFIIPEYQRPYIWSKEEVELLWNDILGSYEENSQEEYFIGPLVVARKEESGGSKVSYVVDGQQRLTTLQCLLWILYNRLSANTIPDKEEILDDLNRLLTIPGDKNRLSVAARDQSNYLATREGAIVDETNNLGVAIMLLREKIGNLPSEELIGFANYVQNKLRVILVQTDSFASAWELFIGLNGKGKPLTPADLIKAYICGSSSDSEEAANIWEEHVVPLSDDSTSAILDVCRSVTGEASADAKLFKTFEDAWKNKRVNTVILSSGCKTYQKFWHLPVGKVEELPKEGAKFLRSLRTMRRRDITPVLISLADCFGYDSIFSPSLLKVLDSYQLWMAICGLRGRERIFSKEAHKIRKGKKDLASCLMGFAALLKSLAPDEGKVLESIKISAYRGRVMLHIVKSHEEGMRGDVQIENVWYEHIMPQTGTEYWYSVAGTKDKNLYSRIVNNIGNIAPLDPSTNIKGRNDPWATKRNLYMQEVSNWLIAEIARVNPTDWNPTKIEDRANVIAKWAVEKRWPLTSQLQGLGV